MQSIKLRFSLSHTLAELFSYTLLTLGSTGVVTVDKEELLALYKDYDSTMYAVEDFIESLDEQALIEAYFKPIGEWQELDKQNLLEINEVVGYFDDEIEPPKTSATLEQVLAKLSEALASSARELGGEYRFLGAELIVDEDWAEAWKEFYSPMHLSPRITVSPGWLAYQAERPEELVLEIDPGSAFGTGYHESTEMCLRFLDNLALTEHDFFREARILDLGTGSGILAIAAAKLAAQKLDLVDIDPHAIEVAKDNCLKNKLNVPELNYLSGELKDTAGKYDLIIANLIAKLHVELALDYANKINPGGYLILSGIIDWMLDEVKAEMAKTSLELSEAHMKNEWWSLLYQMPDC